MDRRTFVGSLASSGIASFAPIPRARPMWKSGEFYRGQVFGVSIDVSSGTVYASTLGRLLQITISGAASTFGAPHRGLGAVAFDPQSGGVYAADFFTGELWFAAANRPVQPIFSGGGRRLSGLALDAAKRTLYLCDDFNNSAGAFQLDSRTYTPIASGLKTPRGIAVDPVTGTVYIACLAERSIVTIASDGTIARLGSGIVEASGVARSAQSDLFVTDLYGLQRLSPAGTTDRIVPDKRFIGLTIDDAKGFIYVAAPSGISRVYR